MSIRKGRRDPMSVYHAMIVTSEDYVERRARCRQAHLERILELRNQGLVVAGGPALDGRTAEIFYRGRHPSGVHALIEKDPYYLAGAWKSYTLRSFLEFVDPSELPPLVTDGSRRMTLVDGVTLQADQVKPTLVGLREAGKLGLGGLFEGGETLVLLMTADAAQAVGWLGETAGWREGSLSARSFLYVL
jgi:uncharacterized protein YciI